MLHFLTAGESHGPGCIVIIDGIPANLTIDLNFIQEELLKRSKDFGRGGRGLIETDHVDILSGVMHGHSIGSPITLFVENKDYKNWADKTKEEIQITKPRPGHADLAGALKYGFDDVRPILERASARETTARVAAGAIFKQLLNQFQITLASHTVQIGNARLDKKDYDFNSVNKAYESDPDIRCIDKTVSEKMKKEIETAKTNKDTLGGIIEVWAVNVPPGLGSHVQYDEKIDGQIAQSLMSIQSVKTVEIGDSIANVSSYGSQFHDEIFYKESGYYRKTNRAGGIEGGITNGMPIVIRVYHKPISTLYNPLKTVDIKTKEESLGTIERSDVCIVPRAGVVAESMLAFVIAKNLLKKFGSDNLEDIKQTYRNYIERLK